MSNRFDGVPVLIQQIAQSMCDKENSPNIRFNHSTTITTIRDYCNSALSEYEKQKLLGNKRK